MKDQLDVTCYFILFYFMFVLQAEACKTNTTKN